MAKTIRLKASQITSDDLKAQHDKILARLTRGRAYRPNGAREVARRAKQLLKGQVR